MASLMRQVREQVCPVPRHLGQQTRLAAAAQQVTDLRDGQQLGVTAGRSRSRPRRDRDNPGSHQVIDQHVDVDEQVLGRQHGGRPLRWQTDFDNRMSAAEAPS